MTLLKIANIFLQPVSSFRADKLAKLKSVKHNNGNNTKLNFII
jgi:hypothetical protein